MEAMKSQAKATGEEYDRLMEEHRKLQEQLGDGEGDKKDKWILCMVMFVRLWMKNSTYTLNTNASNVDG